MYARKYATAQDGQGKIRVPENYVGNAFREEKEQDTAPTAKECCQREEKTNYSDCSECKGCKNEGTALFPFFNSKMLSSDALLLLLAFLLMGNGEAEDIPGILIFLMLI